MVRVVDPDGVLRTHTALPPIKLEGTSEPGITYLTMRSQKSGPSMLTTYSFTPDGRIRGLNVPQELRLVHIGFAPDGSEGFRSEINIGPVIGKEIGFVNTNPLVPGPGSGTGYDPFRFQGVGDYVLTDSEGQAVGGFTAQFLEGRTFAMQLAGASGQMALRFGFFRTHSEWHRMVRGGGRNAAWQHRCGYCAACLLQLVHIASERPGE